MRSMTRNQKENGAKIQRSGSLMPLCVTFSRNFYFEQSSHSKDQSLLHLQWHRAHGMLLGKNDEMSYKKNKWVESC